MAFRRPHFDPLPMVLAFALAGGVPLAACSGDNGGSAVSLDRDGGDGDAQPDATTGDDAGDDATAPDGGVDSDADVDSDSDAGANADADASSDAGSDAAMDGEADAAEAGCTSSAGCPTGQACDVSMGVCTSACSSLQPCNGGCCSAATGGTCVAGTAATACGTSGVCADCTTSCTGAHEACGCDPNTQQCADTSITTFTATPSTVTNPGGSNSSTLAWATAGATSCGIDDGIGPVSCTGTMVVTPAATTTYTLSATGPGGTTTATATVTVQYCHAIVDVDTGAPKPCPTGATQFCEPVAIMGTNTSQAQDACNACFGAGTCAMQSPWGWWGPNHGTVFEYTTGGQGNPYCAQGFTPGDIANVVANGAGCPVSRWAP